MFSIILVQCSTGKNLLAIGSNGNALNRNYPLWTSAVEGTVHASLNRDLFWFSSGNMTFFHADLLLHFLDVSILCSVLVGSNEYGYIQICYDTDFRNLDTNRDYSNRLYIHLCLLIRKITDNPFSYLSAIPKSFPCSSSTAHCNSLIWYCN